MCVLHIQEHTAHVTPKQYYLWHIIKCVCFGGGRPTEPKLLQSMMSQANSIQ